MNDITTKGKLILVGTPLGNRGDLSERAKQAILGADLLLCEDTRSPTRLLGEQVAHAPRLSCFAHNEAQRVDETVAAVNAGKCVVFISEAGMPVISDPGQLLAQAAWEHQLELDVIPGPCAATTALAASGFSSVGAIFYGFIARSGKERDVLLRQLCQATGPVVFYEAGNRVRALIRDLSAIIGEDDPRLLFIGREMTKLHQQFLRATPRELAVQEFDTRGEFTLVLQASTQTNQDEVDAHAAARAVFAAFCDTTTKPRERARKIAELTGLDAREIYKTLSDLSKLPTSSAAD